MLILTKPRGLPSILVPGDWLISINTIIIIIIYINIAILPIALINVIKHLNKIVVTNNQNTFYYDSLIENNTRKIIQRELKRNRIVSPLEIDPSPVLKGIRYV